MHLEEVPEGSLNGFAPQVSVPPFLFALARVEWRRLVPQGAPKAASPGYFMVAP